MDSIEQFKEAMEQSFRRWEAITKNNSSRDLMIHLDMMWDIRAVAEKADPALYEIVDQIYQRMRETVTAKCADEREEFLRKQGLL